jgi:LPS-assembly protein
VLTDSMDLTFEPVITTKQGIVLGGEFRQRLRNGFYEVEASGTVADRTTGTNETRSSRQQVPRSRQGKTASTSTRPARRHRPRPHHRQDPHAPLATGRNRRRGCSPRASRPQLRRGRAYAFQGLRPEDRDSRQPIVTPTATVHYLGEPNDRGATGRPTPHLNLYRQDGTDSRRISINGGWQMPWRRRWATATSSPPACAATPTGPGRRSTRWGFEPDQNATTAG